MHETPHDAPQPPPRPAEPARERPRPRANGADASAEAARNSQRDRAIEGVLALNPVFWRDVTDDSFVTLTWQGRTMRCRIRSEAFRRLVRFIYGTANQVSRAAGGQRPASLGDQSVAETVSALDALALRGEQRHGARARSCFWRGGIWIDLGDETWNVIHVTPEGWSIVSGADVPLVRPAGMLALPHPERGGNVELLARYFGRAGDDGFKLTVGWLVMALFPSGPYPVLAVDGEQDSGKTTFVRHARTLVDPNVADVTPLPRDERDLIIACSNSSVLALDNLSGLPPEMADTICRIATGSGFRARKLYTDSDETILRVCNPVLLNGIPTLLARGDLADRAIAITLPAVRDANRQTEDELREAFEADRPKMLGLLLDGLSLAMRDMHALRLDALPRMATFARVACAAAPAFIWTAGEMLGAMEANRAATVATVVETDVVASAVAALAHGHTVPWEGTASDLLAALAAHTTEERRRERDWPRDATRLSRALRRAAPALRRAGIDVAQRRDGTARRIRITVGAGSDPAWSADL